MSMPRTTWQSFCQKLDMSGGENACWMWKGYVSRRYGVISMNNRPVRSNRAAWILHYGPIPEGMVVCHSCDRPLCCNPKHLFLGTVQDNNKDKQRKGRHVYGERSSHRLLNYADVLNIRRQLNDGRKGASLAAEFGVSKVTISAIKVGRIWNSPYADYSIFENGGT